MMRVVLSIGSNMGDSAAALSRVAGHFRDCLVGASSLWQTPAWGPVSQEDFLNAILVVETKLTLIQLLRECQRLEKAAGRVRDVRWGPRTLDVDIVDASQVVKGRNPVDYPKITSASPVVTVPHPRASERAFVLVPWHEVEPAARLGSVPIATLIERLDPADLSGLVRLSDAAWTAGPDDGRRL